MELFILLIPEREKKWPGNFENFRYVITETCRSHYYYDWIHTSEGGLLVFEGIQDFKLGGRTLKKIAPIEGRRENFWGISCEKSRFYAKKSYFFQF
jgi:hypothetical protein